MSGKRDEDAGADMEVGMTTAERRRRRRRGGGLRVPSDNVPRSRTPTAPPAPVPEDPALAMSIAYSFTSDASGPVRTVSNDSATSIPSALRVIGAAQDRRPPAVTFSTTPSIRTWRSRLGQKKVIAARGLHSSCSPLALS